jgi:outer membrane protein assembly factor BamB
MIIRSMCWLMLLFFAGCSAIREEEPVKVEDSSTPKPAQTEKATEGNRSCPMFGCTPQRNLANTDDTGITSSWSIKKGKEANVKWVADLGTMAYGGPVIAGGKIFVGTNNDRPRDPAIKGDKGVVMCFRQSDGKFLWQAVHDKLDNPDANDVPKHGVASSPAVDGDRLYYVSNRCELVCADVEGDQAIGKAKFIWKLDMAKDLGVYPCCLANSSPVIVDDLVYVLTGNGTVYGNTNVPAPEAPSLVAVNKNTGKVAWQKNDPGAKILEGQWSSPAIAEVRGKKQVIFAGGDGWLRGYEPKSGELLWKFDCNPKGAGAFKPGGRSNRNYPIAVPVVYDNKVYVGVGQDPEAGPGVGHMWCVDLTKKPANKDLDLSPVGDNFDPRAEVNKNSGLVWHYGGPVLPKPEDGREVVFGRTLSTVAIHDGLLYAAEMEGFLHCLDAKTGKNYWTADLKDGTWDSPYYVDGKVFLGTAGDLHVFQAGKVLKELPKIDMETEIKVPPVAVNGVLYVNTGSKLFAIAAK